MGEHPTTSDEAHRVGLLTVIEVADELGLLSTEVLDLMARGDIESVRVANRPCAAPEAVQAYIAARKP